MTAPQVLLIPTARPTFAVEVAAQRAEAARDLLTELGADVFGPTNLVMTADDVAEAAAYLRRPRDLLINVCASFSDATPALELYRDVDAPVLLWSFHEPGPTGDRLWLNSLCGANLFAHALQVVLGREGRLVYGDPWEPQVRATLAAALSGRLPDAIPAPAAQRARTDDEAAVTTALDRLRGSRIGLVGDAPAGFTPSRYDGGLLHRLFGIEVTELTVEEMFDQVRSAEPQACASERRAALTAQPSLAELDPDRVAGHAAITTALAGWRDDAQLAAMAIRCWPEFPTELGTCPCSSLSRIADAGTPTACERDVYGATTMLLMEALGAGTTYLVDTVDLDAAANVVRLWHCGAAATALAADPAQATQFVHCNRKIGVAGNFPLRTGRVIVARLTENPGGDGLRLLVAAGESLPEPNRFQGNTAAVRLDCNAEHFVRGLVDGGFPHHTVLAWSDVRPALRAAADRLDIPVIEW